MLTSPRSAFKASDLAVNVKVPGRPVPMPRPRFFNGRVVSNTPKAKAWKRVVAMVVRARFNRVIYSGPVRVSLSFWYLATAPAIAREGIAICSNLDDLDNLAKAVLDAMEGIVYVNDRQVHRLELSKWKTGDPEQVGVEIQVYG